MAAMQNLYSAEIICNNLLPLWNRARETLLYDLRNVPGISAQIIEVRIISKNAACVKHAAVHTALVVLADRLQSKSHPCPFLLLPLHLNLLSG